MRSIIFERIWGEIIMVIKGSENDCLNSLRHLGISTHSYIEGWADPNTQYVDVVTEELRDKQTFDIAVEGNNVSGVPVGTQIRMPNRELHVMDESRVIELTGLDHPEKLLIQLRHPHYLESSGDIEVDYVP